MLLGFYQNAGLHTWRRSEVVPIPAHSDTGVDDHKPINSHGDTFCLSLQLSNPNNFFTSHSKSTYWRFLIGKNKWIILLPQVWSKMNQHQIFWLTVQDIFRSIGRTLHTV